MSQKLPWGGSLAADDASPEAGYFQGSRQVRMRKVLGVTPFVHNEQGASRQVIIPTDNKWVWEACPAVMVLLSLGV